MNSYLKNSLLIITIGVLILSCSAVDRTSSDEPSLSSLTVSIDLEKTLQKGFNVSSIVASIIGESYGDTIIVSKIDTTVSILFDSITAEKYLLSVKIYDDNCVITEGEGDVTVNLGEINSANVIIVSWDEAEVPMPNTFLGKIRAKSELLFDLPTEAQWEYVCRAGSDSSYYNGKNCTTADPVDTLQEIALDSIAWYGYFWEGEASGVGTREVGTKAPNAFGFYDMLGNLWEMCLDWYDDYPGTVTDPVGPSTGQMRIARGGSWHGWPAVTRSAQRQYAKSGRMSGFRVTAPVPINSKDTTQFLLVNLLNSSGNLSLTIGTSSSLPTDFLTNPKYKDSCIVLKKVKAGTFIMGSPETEVGRDTQRDETTHSVTISKDFYMALFETTQGQWEQVMNTNPSYYRGSSLPVETVDWNFDIRGGFWPPEYLSSRASSYKLVLSVIQK